MNQTQQLSAFQDTEVKFDWYRFFQKSYDELSVDQLHRAIDLHNTYGKSHFELHTEPHEAVLFNMQEVLLGHCYNRTHLFKSGTTAWNECFDIYMESI